MNAIRNVALVSGLAVLVGIVIQSKSDQPMSVATTGPAVGAAPSVVIAPAPSATTEPAASSRPASQPASRPFGSVEPQPDHQARSFWERSVQPPCNCPLCRQRRETENNMVPQGRVGE